MPKPQYGHLQRHPAIIRNQMYAFFNVIREQKELVTAQLFSHYEILHFCLPFTSLAFLVVCLCFVWFRWLGMKASGAVWLADIYLPCCGAPVYMFDIYLCVAG